MKKYFEQGVIDAFNNKSILERNIKSTRGSHDYLDGIAFGEHLLHQIFIREHIGKRVNKETIMDLRMREKYEVKHDKKI